MSPMRPLLPASTRVRLLAAACVWSAVGVVLLALGTRWLLASGVGSHLPVLVAAGALGWVKGRFVLGPRARANSERIAGAPDRAPLLHVFTMATWALVGGMMATGYVLRHSGLPWPVVGSIYAAVGVALIVGAAPSWAAWARTGRSA